MLLVLVVGFVGYAEAYDGKIDVSFDDSTPNEPINGYKFLFKGLLINSEPSQNSLVQINLLDVNGGVIDTFEVKVDSDMTLFEDVEETWKFDFEIDTNNYDLLTDTRYHIEVIYEDKTDLIELVVYPTLEQSIIDSSIAKAERENAEMLTEPIPEWIRNIFVFYANNEISDQDLINALQYLIDMKILQV